MCKSESLVARQSKLEERRESSTRANHQIYLSERADNSNYLLANSNLSGSNLQLADYRPVELFYM